MPNPSDAVSSSDVNPLATRFIRPGAIPYRFPAGTSAESLVHTLSEHAWWGQIVGPHGSGKSSLLASLKPCLESSGRTIQHFQLTQANPALDIDGSAIRSWGRNTQVVIDGFEQLGWWKRFWLKGVCARRRTGLLITAHRDLGLPLLFSTKVSAELAQSLVQDLMRGSAVSISPDEVRECFQRCRGNLRETLFQVYDLVERRK